MIPPPRVATARAPATCGELCQGVLEARDFLITCPIDRFASVTVTPTGTATELVIHPDGLDYSKVARAARLALAELGVTTGLALQVDSELPRGKGLASSSADITATIHAVAEAHGRTLTPDIVSRLAIAIEPSDGVFYAGVVIYDHVGGTLFERLGEPPPLAFVIVDEGGAVDTVAFDRDRARANAHANQATLVEAVALIRRGIQGRDPALIARGATASARCNQAVLAKPDLEPLLAAIGEVGGLGVNCAHSGTVLGVMFDPTRTDETALVRRVTEVVGERKVLGCARLVSGGTRPATSDARVR